MSRTRRFLSFTVLVGRLAVLAGRLAVLAVSGCESPLTVALDRKAIAQPGDRFEPTTPRDGSTDASDDEFIPLHDPTDSGGTD